MECLILIESISKGVFRGGKGENPPTGNFCKNLYNFYIFILLDYLQIMDKERKKSLKFPPGYNFPQKNPRYAFGN